MTRTTRNKRVDFSPIFNRQVQKAPLHVKLALRSAIATFLENPHDVSLRNHTLGKEHAGKRSIDITDDWRALYREERERIIFVELGTHAQLYKR
jgi:addiction module RelE/StbE family toxin